MLLPRMSFEITDILYDGERKLPRTLRNSVPQSANTAIFSTAFVPVPYNLTVELAVMAKYMEDGTKIIEQILPYFMPEFTPSVKLLDDLDYYLDVPIVLNNVSMEDSYEGDFKERRALIWTLSFTVKGWYFGPTTPKKVVKFITIDTYTSLDAANSASTITIQPGLTANGVGTTVLANTIPYTDINSDDPWDYIVQITDND